MPKETANHKLKKPLYSDNADIAVINENFDAIDELLTPSVYATTAPDSAAVKGKLTAVLGWLANRIKAITGQNSWQASVPNCKHIKMQIEIENTGSGTVLGRTWDFFVYRQSYGWYEVCAFTLPDDGKYTIDRDMPGYTITRIACVPSSNPGSSRTWNTWYGIEQLTITETVTVNELTTGTFQYGVFANYYGLEQKLTEVYANIDGTLKQATYVLVNIDGALVSLPKVNSAYLKTESDSMTLYGFTPSVSGSYRITQKKISGDHEIRLYGSDFTPLYDGYFYDRSFDLDGGTLYYITVTHYRGADTSESYLQIYKEA